jgi:hypothetical protein
MNNTLIRIAKRLMVLAVGALVAYITVWQVFPFFDRRTSLVLAVLATYVAMAYIILPAGLRAIRLFYRPRHIPLYCVTPDGFASDPINIGLIGSRSQIINAMEEAGWRLADPRTPKTLLKVALAMLLSRSYSSAPFSTLYLFGRRQDVGFEVSVAGHASHRHHVRFWACNLQGPEEFHQDVNFWRRLHQPYLSSPQRQLWVGAASKDIGLSPIRHNAQITHLIAPNTDEERELIVKNLQNTDLLAGVHKVSASKGYSLRNRALRGYLSTDGQLAICELKSQA